MISTPAEAADFAAMCTTAGLQTPGVMVEVPSAALTARHLLDRVEFASLGTNDLTQYAMAADRQLGPLAALNDPWQPAVLALVAATVDGAVAQAKHSAALALRILRPSRWECAVRRPLTRPSPSYWPDWASTACP